MKKFFKFLLMFFGFMSDFVVLGGLAFLIGLWWIPQLSTFGAHPLLNATIIFLPYCHIYYKWVIQQRRNHTPFHLYFYSALTILAVLGYLYGIIFKW